MPDLNKLAKPAPTANLNGGSSDRNAVYGELTKDQIREKYTINLGGKKYLQVAGRVLCLRGDHPDWSIIPEILEYNNEYIFAKATIRNERYETISVGHALLRPENKTGPSAKRLLESCETAAVGRACAFAGYGTDEVGEDENLADSPV